MLSPWMAMEKLGDLIMTRIVEPVAWRTEYRYGKNCFWIAQVLLAVQMLLATLIDQLMFAGHNLTWVAIGMVASTCFLSWVIRWQESDTIRDYPAHNSSRKYGASRVMFLFIPVVWLSDTEASWVVQTLRTLDGIVLFMTIMFVSCDLMPRGWKPPSKRTA